PYRRKSAVRTPLARHTSIAIGSSGADCRSAVVAPDVAPAQDLATCGAESEREWVASHPVSPFRAYRTARFTIVVVCGDSRTPFPAQNRPPRLCPRRHGVRRTPAPGSERRFLPAVSRGRNARARLRLRPGNHHAGYRGAHRPRVGRWNGYERIPGRVGDP